MTETHTAPASRRDSDTEHPATAHGRDTTDQNATGRDPNGDRDAGADHRILALAPEVARQLRTRDDAGNPPRLVTDDTGGAPLRCCLGRSRPGETIALASYAPLHRWAVRTGATPGPYDERGPVFLHAEECRGRSGGAFPDALLGERRVLRAYAAAGNILGGLLVPGEAAAIADGLDELYRDPAVAVVHVRAVEFGCFLAETRRAAAPRHD